MRKIFAVNTILVIVVLLVPINVLVENEIASWAIVLLSAALLIVQLVLVAQLILEVGREW